ncbi:hypothetical protein RDV64_20305 [Acuticoccus sp. MNP-M23]|uniref:hypothetical protein n=1 Tax=Acuticoccus sp. MNP-M23 TaxID=3072793 RepID=UPI00281575CD|nr:hypothetical protein [Acuticoccus sp. MNP-M23]WMS42378.1 hypothetical protein RDV64_20305 [Acuticoccus sp. MNP-M23]
MSDLSHIATARLAVPAEIAFEFITDPLSLGRWSFGCWSTQRTPEEGLYTGTSLFDKSETWFHVETDAEQLTATYHVGTRLARSPRIVARVVRGSTCNLGDGACYVSLIAWRAADMDDARWERLRRAHDLEILLIQAQCEGEYAAGGTLE